MNEMLSKMIVDLKGKYRSDDLRQLEEIENELRLNEFNSDISLKIGMLIVKNSKKYNEDLIVKITRVKDNETVFQYIGENKSQRNIVFADMKANAVKLSGHSSIYTLVKMVVQDAYKNEIDDNCLPVAGAFPLFVKDEMVGIIAVSGMHNGLDHTVIVEGLFEYLDKEVKKFEGILI